MKKLQVFTLGGQEGYAITLPINDPTEPNFGPILSLFEQLVDLAGLRAYHKNPGNEQLTEQQQMDTLNKYYYQDETQSLFLALFFVSESDAMYARMLKFAEITEDTFKKNNLL